MVEAAAIVAGWLTPTSLFVLLNIVIATIFFTSAFGIGIGTAANHGDHTATKKSADDHHHHQHPESGGKPQLLRAPSLFSRVTSFNFGTHHYSNYDPHHHHSDDQARPDPAFGRSPSLLSRVASFNLCRAQAQPDPAHDVSVVAQEAAAHHHDDDESKEGSETDSAGDESREGKMATTEKKEDNEREEGEAKKKKKVVAVRRKMAKTVPFRGTDDDEVDAKADDFINKFKQQLKLQRLESLLRYRSPATVTANAT